MANEHSLIHVDEETWQSIAGPRDVYDTTSKTWKHVDETTWSMLSHNAWGGKLWETELEFEAVPVDGYTVVYCPLLTATELNITFEINVVSGKSDFSKLLMESLPWYLKEDEVIRNLCIAGGAILATVESYLLIVEQSATLHSSIETLVGHEDDLGIQAGTLTLSERRDNIRRLWHMMNENVSWSPNEVYYLPFIGEYSASNQRVDGTVIHDLAHKNNPIVQAKVAQWANVNGLEVVQ